MSHINIEIKAWCKDQELIREFLRTNNAEYKGLDHQIDTYFKIPYGRLKLREGNIENYLIHYKREDQNGPKQSNVTLFKYDSESNLKKLLLSALEVLVVVDKQREIYFIDNVKFHLDSVEELGNFVEIEAIDKIGNIGKSKLLEQCEYYLGAFNINDTDLIFGSYSDMILVKNKSNLK